MGIESVRALAASIVQTTLGVSVTVTILRTSQYNRPPGDVSIATTGVWRTLPEEGQPFGADLSRRQPRRVLAIPLSPTLTAIPRGSLIAAPEIFGGPVLNWRADGLVEGERGPLRVLVVPAAP